MPNAYNEVTDGTNEYALYMYTIVEVMARACVLATLEIMPRSLLAT